MTKIVPDGAITPAEFAASLGCSERLVRERARAIGACRIFGKKMYLMPEDVAALWEASKPQTAMPAQGPPKTKDSRNISYADLVAMRSKERR